MPKQITVVHCLPFLLLLLRHRQGGRGFQPRQVGATGAARAQPHQAVRQRLRLHGAALPSQERPGRRQKLRQVYIRKGASIEDVRTEGGRGVSPKEDVVREVA